MPQIGGLHEAVVHAHTHPLKTWISSCLSWFASLSTFCLPGQFYFTVAPPCVFTNLLLRLQVHNILGKAWSLTYLGSHRVSKKTLSSRHASSFFIFRLEEIWCCNALQWSICSNPKRRTPLRNKGPASVSNIRSNKPLIGPDLQEVGTNPIPNLNDLNGNVWNEYVQCKSIRATGSLGRCKTNWISVQYIGAWDATVIHTLKTQHGVAFRAAVITTRTVCAHQSYAAC